MIIIKKKLKIILWWPNTQEFVCMCMCVFLLLLLLFILEIIFHILCYISHSYFIQINYWIYKTTRKHNMK
jgi:hypothetical protein